MVDFPADYKIRTESDADDYLVSKYLKNFQKQLSCACIDMDWKNSNGQIIDHMFMKDCDVYRVYDTDGIKKYQLWSGIDPFFVERLDHTQMIDDMFKKRNTPSMHIKYSLHSIIEPDKDLRLGLVARTFFGLVGLPVNLRMCRLNKTR